MKTTIIIILILFSIIAQSFLFNDSAIAQSSEIQALSNQGNWEFINYNNKATNHIPQNDINKENVHLLELKWIYPLPPASEFLRYQSGGIPFEGVITPPLIIDGNVFVASNMRNVYSFDGKFGDLNWLRIYKHDWNEAKIGLPEIAGGAPHIHGLQHVITFSHTEAPPLLLGII